MSVDYLTTACRLNAGGTGVPCHSVRSSESMGGNLHSKLFLSPWESALGSGQGVGHCLDCGLISMDPDRGFTEKQLSHYQLGDRSDSVFLHYSGPPVMWLPEKVGCDLSVGLKSKQEPTNQQEIINHSNICFVLIESRSIFCFMQYVKRLLNTNEINLDFFKEEVNHAM